MSQNNRRRINLDILCNCNLCSNNYDYDERLGKFTSTITGTSFDLNIRNDNNLSPCELNCVIYLITCSNCNLQYVGKTKQKLKQRFSGHKHCCKMKKTKISLILFFRSNLPVVVGPVPHWTFI